MKVEKSQNHIAPHKPYLYRHITARFERRHWRVRVSIAKESAHSFAVEDGSGDGCAGEKSKAGEIANKGFISREFSEKSKACQTA
jgi:hypothetical protein